MHILRVYPQKRHCVYTHSHEGTVFYVGQGIGGRPLQTINRNAWWKAYVATIESYDVEIVLWTDDPVEAQLTEARLIRQLAPQCNQKMNGYEPPGRAEKIAQALMGHPVTEQVRQKLSLARTGLIPNGWQGRQHTPEARQKIGLNQHRIPVICIETGESFPSLKAASEALHISKTNLRHHLAGRYRHVSGYTFRHG